MKQAIPLELIKRMIRKDKIKIYSKFLKFKELYPNSIVKRNIAELARIFNVGRQTMYAYIKELEENEFIGPTERKKEFVLIGMKKLLQKEFISWKGKRLILEHEKYNLSIHDYLYTAFLMYIYEDAMKTNKKFSTAKIMEDLKLSVDRTKQLMYKLVDLGIFSKKYVLISVNDGKFSSKAVFYHPGLRGYYAKITVYEPNEEIRQNIINPGKE